MFKVLEHTQASEQDGERDRGQERTHAGCALCAGPDAGLALPVLRS